MEEYFDSDSDEDDESSFVSSSVETLGSSHPALSYLPDYSHLNVQSSPNAVNKTIQDLIRKDRKGELLLPVFQRKWVWTHDDMNRLYETILMGLPIPEIFVNEIEDPKTRKQIWYLIDGQHRSFSILDFVSGKHDFTTPSNDIVSFKDLEKATQTRIKNTKIAVRILPNWPDDATRRSYVHLQGGKKMDVGSMLNATSAPITAIVQQDPLYSEIVISLNRLKKFKTDNDLLTILCNFMLFCKEGTHKFVGNAKMLSQIIKNLNPVPEQLIKRYQNVTENFVLFLNEFYKHSKDMKSKIAAYEIYSLYLFLIDELDTYHVKEAAVVYYGRQYARIFCEYKQLRNKKKYDVIRDLEDYYLSGNRSPNVPAHLIMRKNIAAYRLANRPLEEVPVAPKPQKRKNNSDQNNNDKNTKRAKAKPRK